jgi:hypothetical protein
MPRVVGFNQKAPFACPFAKFRESGSMVLSFLSGVFARLGENTRQADDNPGSASFLIISETRS